MNCANCGHPDLDHKTRRDTSCSNVFENADTTKQYCQCEVFIVEDVLPLSEYEKAVVLEFRQNIPNWLSPERDFNDLTNLSNQEKAMILLLRESMQITFDEPVEASSVLQMFAFTTEIPNQKFYCANCGLKLKSAENENAEFACDCAEEGKKYNFPLITQDPNEHIRRKKLRNG